jgi:predicted 2-oxoglutarate/Fe(II)-dependent dioxygenase YbiX
MTIINLHPFDKILTSTIAPESVNKITQHLSKLEHNWNFGLKFDKNEDNFSYDSNIRHCQISWIKDKYLKDYVFQKFLFVNKKFGFNYVIDGMEDIQYTIYNEGCHYDWHTDYACDPDAKRCRKMSMSLVLNQVGTDYEGGEFQFQSSFPGQLKFDTRSLNLGDMVIFSTYTPHRVLPVLSGKREVLVAWAWGPLFT